MKSILMSIKPKYCDLIASGNKTIEVRKTIPKVKTPFNCYIYECKGKEIFKSMEIPKGYGEGYIDFYEFEGRGKIIGEFVCDEIQILFNTNGNPKNYMKDILPNILKNLSCHMMSFQDMLVVEQAEIIFTAGTYLTL